MMHEPIEAIEGYKKQYSVYKLKQEQVMRPPSSNLHVSPIAHTLSAVDGGPVFFSRDDMVQIYQDPDVANARNTLGMYSNQIRDRTSKGCMNEIQYTPENVGFYVPSSSANQQQQQNNTYFMPGSNINSREEARRSRVLDKENSRSDKPLYYVPRYA